jgi:hypothetical protein
MGWSARFPADYPYILDFFDWLRARIYYVRQGDLSDIKTGEGAEMRKLSFLKLGVF